MLDLKEGWDGASWFAIAYQLTLPREELDRVMTEPPVVLPRTDWLATMPKPRRTVTRTRGGFTYEKGSNPYFGGRRSATWRDFMIRTTLAHTSTWEATAAHHSSGQYLDKKLDFSWMLKENYIRRS